MPTSPNDLPNTEDLPDDDLDLVDIPDADEDVIDDEAASDIPESDDDLVNSGDEEGASSDSDEPVDPDGAEDDADILGEDADETAEPAPGPASSNGPRMPVFEPMHNVREVAKQLVLLEDHLAQPDKHCPDCIRKHLLTAEAFAEEAVTLDKTGQYRDLLVPLPEKIRAIGRAYLGADKPSRHAVAQRARELRKELSKVGFSSVSGAGANAPSSSATTKPKVPLDVAVAKVKQALKGLPGLHGVKPGDRCVKIAASPDLIGRLPSEVLGWPIVARGISLDPRTKPVAASRYAGSKNLHTARIKPGMAVLYGKPLADGKVEWRRGHAIAIENETVTVSDRDAGRLAVHPGRVVLAPAKPVSSELRGRMVERWWIDDRSGTPVEKAVAPYRLGEQALVVADVIQSLFEAHMGNLCENEVRFAEAAVPAVQSLSPEAAARLRTFVCTVIVPNKVLRGALVNAIYESNLKPEAVGDGGNSVGLWQLNIRGAGAGMTVAERQDPVIATKRILEEFVRRASSAWFRNPITRDIAAGVARQPKMAPSIGEYAKAWAIEVERPKYQAAEGALRQRTADRLFGAPNVTSWAEAAKEKVQETVAPVVETVGPVVEPVVEAVRPVVETVVPPAFTPWVEPVPERTLVIPPEREDGGFLTWPVILIGAIVAGGLALATGIVTLGGVRASDEGWIR